LFLKGRGITLTIAAFDTTSRERPKELASLEGCLLITTAWSQGYRGMVNLVQKGFLSELKLKVED